MQTGRSVRHPLQVLFAVLFAFALTVMATAASAAAAEVPRPTHVRIVQWQFDGATFILSGTAVPETVLRVLVQVGKNSDWTKVARSTVGLDRTWQARFPDPTQLGGAVDGRFNIRVEQATTVQTSLRFQGTVRWDGTAAPVAYNPDTLPAGAATSHAFLSVDGSGVPAHWDPCAPIPYFVNSSSLPDGAAATVAEVFARVAAISGATFVDGGATALIAGAGGSPIPVPDRGEGIYVAFADPTVVPDLTGSVLGLGGHYFSSWPSPDMRITVGTIVVDTTDGLAPGFTSGTSIGGVLEHELGHVLGLAHIDDPTQLMYPHARPTGPSTFQAGDRAGLVALHAGTCPAPAVS
ncbi:MAG: matrixin family metalloprotease [Actinobacteria bacterium]|nr:matrixin family metalloprotease [Actinomycetota bacterium]